MCQAFRAGWAWGLLFHAEADRWLLDRWLTRPEMVEEAEHVLGRDAAERLRRDADCAEPALLTASDALFARFAAEASRAAASAPPDGDRA